MIHCVLMSLLLLLLLLSFCEFDIVNCIGGVDLWCLLHRMLVNACLVGKILPHYACYKETFFMSNISPNHVLYCPQFSKDEGHV